MKAVEITPVAHADNEDPAMAQAVQFLDIDAAMPKAHGHDLLIEVTATSVNPIDLKLASRLQAGGSLIAGFDAVGTIKALGEQVTDFSLGERVFYSGSNKRPGANAEFQLVDERIVARAPSHLDDAASAAFPLVSLTAWECLFDRLGIGVDTHGTLLVLGGAGGVPSMVIQLARALTGLEVLATASRKESRDWVEELGAHRVIDHTKDVREELADARGSVNFVFSSYTTGREQELADVMAPQSEMVMIDDPVDFDILPFKALAAGVHWENMFVRANNAALDPQQARIQGQILSRISDLLNTGRIKPIEGQRLHGLEATTIEEAHQVIAAAKSIGKITIEY